MKKGIGCTNKKLIGLLFSLAYFVLLVKPQLLLAQEDELLTLQDAIPASPLPLLSPSPAPATQNPINVFKASHLAPVYPLATEAPEAFFDFKLGDKDVEFFLTGSWHISLWGSLGFMSRKETGLTELDAFPGLTSGFYFEQTPELTFSVWLIRQYFAEFSLSKDFKESAFLVGYEGRDDELVQHVYFGSQKINLEPYPFMTFPDQGESSLGLEAELKVGPTRQQLLARFDNNDQGNKIFIGQNEVVENTIPLYNYLQGQCFKLPDAGVENIRVYLEDANALATGNDGKRYRSVKYDEVTIDAVTGLLFFKSQPSGRILVYYTKNGYPIGTPGQGLGTGSLASIDADGIVDTSMPVDFDWNTSVNYPAPHTIASTRKVLLEGRECLLLWEPSVFSPFEVESSYILPEGTPEESWRTRITLVNSLGNLSHSAKSVQYLLKPDEDRFLVYLTEDFRNELDNMYPFISVDKRLYGPYTEKIAGNYAYELLIQTFSPISSYYLEPDILAGSVQIKRNGQDENRFSVDYETGVLVFHTPIQALDRLEVTYKKRGALLNNGELLLALGSKIDINERLWLDLATGLHWNFLPGAFSEKAFTHTGSILTSAQLTGEFEQVNFRLATGITYNQQDTTGRLRLLGMEGSGLDIFLDESLAYPAAPPKTNVELPVLGGRGKLLYKNYRQYEVLGGYTLKPPDWSLPAEQIFAYSDNSPSGPYQVAGSSSGSTLGQSLVLDFELNATNDWVGCQFPVIPGERDLDLSSLKGLTFSYRVIDYTDNFDVYLQLGELGEDLDNDLRLDKESSASAAGFLFDDSDNGVTLRVGGGPQLTGNLRLDSEDFNKNDSLDPEVLTHVYTVHLAAVTGNTNWKLYNCTFDEQTRKKLIRSRAIRLLVVNASGSNCKGRLLVDRLSLPGTSWGIIDNSDSGQIYIQEIRESEISTPPAHSLENTYDEVKTVFHPGGQIQKVVELNWNSYTADESWTVRSFTQTPSEGADYREIHYYMRLPVLAAAPARTPQFRFALLDEQGRGINWIWNIPETDFFSDWREVTVDIQDLTVSIAGNRIASAIVKADSGYGSLNQWRITVTNAADGILYLDELYLAASVGTWGGVIDINTNLDLPGPLLNLGSVPLFADLYLTEHLQVASPGFAPFYGRPYKNWQSSTLTELAIDILYCGLEIDLSGRGTGTAFSWEGGHQLKIPEPDIESPFRFNDAYNMKQAAYGIDFDRSNILDINLPGVVSSSIKTNTAVLDSFMKQTWEGRLVLYQPLLRQPEDILFETLLFLSLSQDNYRNKTDDYLTSWITDYSLILPWEEGVLRERTGSLQLKLNSPPASIQVQAAGETGFLSSVFQSTSRQQTNRLSYELAIPMLFNKDEQFYLTPGYRRTWTGLNEESGWSDFEPDTERLFYRLSTQPYLINQIPFYEFFASTTETTFIKQSASLSEAHYEPKFSLSLNRRLASRLADLFLPVKLDFNLSKALDKQNLLSRFLTKYNFVYKAQTINLFGAYGRYPFFDFYKIDEFMNSFNFSLTYDQETDFVSSEYILESYLSFEGEQHNLFTINNKWWLNNGETYKIEDNLTLSFNWFVYPKPGKNLPFKQAFSLFNQNSAREDFISHEESLTIRISKSDNIISSHPLNLLISHKTNFQYPDHGFWGVKITLGMDKEDIFYSQESEAVYRFIISAGLEGQFQF